jgi:hypothetical protein
LIQEQNHVVKVERYSRRSIRDHGGLYEHIMLSLTRLARSRPGLGSVILPRATGRISGPRLQRLSRSYSDERPFDSGSLSVPIPFESRQKIELSGNRKAKPSRQAVSPTTTPIAPRSPSRAKKSQRQIGRERALARRQRNNQAKAKAKVGGKAKDVEHYAEKEGSEATKVKNEATSLEDRTASTKELGPKEIDGMWFISMVFWMCPEDCRNRQ